MATRQTALLPEIELQQWAQTLLPPARETLQRLQQQALSANPAQLEHAVQEHLEVVKAARRQNEFIDLERAEVLAGSARKLIRALDSLAPQSRIVAAAAVLYFVTPDDAEDDLASSVGFDDDQDGAQEAGGAALPPLPGSGGGRDAGPRAGGAAPAARARAQGSR